MKKTARAMSSAASRQRQGAAVRHAAPGADVFRRLGRHAMAALLDARTLSDEELGRMARLIEDARKEGA